MTVRRNLFAGALTAALLPLSACMLGPNYRAPTVAPAATGAFAALDAGGAAADPARPDWWRLYDDPVLDGLVARAFANNEDLKAASFNLAAARALVEGAEAGRYPSTATSFTSSYGRSAIANQVLEVNGIRPTDSWVHSAAFNAAWEIDLVGRVRRTIEQARDNAEAVEAARDAVRVSVAAETTRAYGRICTLGRQIEVADTLHQLAARQAEITGKRLEAGDASQFDLARAQVVEAQARAALPPLEGQRRSALFTLAVLLGTPPAEAPQAVLACTAPPLIRTAIPVGDGAALLRRRPDVREADRRFAAATAGIGIALADYFPRVSLLGSFGGTSPKLGDIGSYSARTWGVGPSVSWSFPNFAAVAARVHSQRATADAALATFRSTLLQALSDVEQALAAYGADRDQHAALVDANAKAERAYALSHNQYAAGSLSYLDLLTSEQALIATRTALAQSDLTLVQDQVALFKALGGGWEPPACPAGPTPCPGAPTS
jgi:NodT family efflux transporter outer membrane factor (OMF) lipoprotein